MIKYPEQCSSDNKSREKDGDVTPDSDETNNKSHEALVREMGGYIQPRGPH